METKQVHFAQPVVQPPTVREFSALRSPDRLDSFGSVRACDSPNICRDTLLKAADSIARRIPVGGYSVQTDAAAALLYVGETYLVRHFNLSEDADKDRDAALIVMEEIRAAVRLRSEHQIDWSDIRSVRNNKFLMPHPWQVAILLIQTALDMRPRAVEFVGDQLNAAVSTETAQHLAAATAHESDPSHATRQRGREGVPAKLRDALGGDGGWNVMHHSKRLVGHLRNSVGDGFSSQVPRLAVASGLLLGSAAAATAGAPIAAGTMGLWGADHMSRAAFGASLTAGHSVIAPVMSKLFSGVDRYAGRAAPIVKSMANVVVGDQLMGAAGSVQQTSADLVRQGADVWNTQSSQLPIGEQRERLRQETAT